jgi:hypothetical protein
MEENLALWRIKNWNERFENHHSRPLKSLSWLHFPLDQGDGYADLLDHPEGAAHLGIWLAVVMIAARCDPRGTLRRGAGNPHTCASIARESRAEARLVEDCLPRLVRIGWIEDISTVSNATRESRAESPSPRENPATEERRLEEKRREQTRPENRLDFEERFSAAWDRHKKHRGGVTRQMVAQRLLDVDWDAWEARHVPFCEFWDRAGWTVCTLGMLEWWENGMPLPPPEIVGRKQPSKSKSDLEEFLREAL